MPRYENRSPVPSFLRGPGAFRSLPFGLFILLMASEPVLAGILPAGFDHRWLYGVRSALVLVLLLFLWYRFEELRTATKASPMEWGLGAGVGVLIFVLWIFLDFPPLAFEAKEGFDPTVDGRISLGLAATRLAGAALVVPVMEELFWRSFILRYLASTNFLKVDPRTVGWMPFLVSSAVFASEHRLWFAGFLAGLAYAWLYRRSGNLWIPILAHAVTNALLGAWVLRTASWWFW
jgi:CAAX prenyl protease-like protein